MAARFSRWFSFLIFAICWNSHADGLGTAGGYNAFTFGPLTLSYSDLQGKAAAGDAIVANHYSFGSYASPSQYNLVSRAAVVLRNGSIANGGLFAGQQK
jgi:choice-of-anchor A domain-containing protein